MNEHRDGGGMTALAAFAIRKPTICAINGHAVGIGITMTLTFDIRVAWDKAKIGFVFGKRGIVPEGAAVSTLSRRGTDPDPSSCGSYLFIFPAEAHRSFPCS